MIIWATTQALPGIVPVNGISPLTSTALLDPNYVNGDTDIDSFTPLATGEFTWYHMPTDASGHRARAWRTRGWETIAVAGNVTMIQQFDTDLGTQFELIDPQSFSGTLELEELPEAVSLGSWICPIPAEPGPPAREFSAAFGNPTETEPYGWNTAGNATSPASTAGLNLDWRSPSDGDFIEIYRASTIGQPIVYAHFIDGVQQIPAPEIHFELAVDVKMLGNSGCLKNSNGEFFSVVRVAIRAYWAIPDGYELWSGFAYTQNVDELDFYFPATTEADSKIEVTIPDPPLASGEASFADGNGVSFAPVPLTATGSYTDPGGGTIQGSFDMSIFTFDSPFWWTDPPSL